MQLKPSLLGGSGTAFLLAGAEFFLRAGRYDDSKIPALLLAALGVVLLGSLPWNATAILTRIGACAVFGTYLAFCATRYNGLLDAYPPYRLRDLVLFGAIMTAQALFAVFVASAAAGILRRVFRRAPSATRA